MKLVRKGEFAKLCGVSPGAVSNALKENLSDALVGNLVNADHISALNYREDRQRVPTRQGGRPRNVTEEERYQLVKRTLEIVAQLRDDPMTPSTVLCIADKAYLGAFWLGAFNLSPSKRLEIARYLKRTIYYLQDYDLCAGP